MDRNKSPKDWVDSQQLARRISQHFDLSMTLRIFRFPVRSVSSALNRGKLWVGIAVQIPGESVLLSNVSFMSL